MVWGPCTYGFSIKDLAQFYSDFNVNNDVNLLQQQGYPGLPGGDNWIEGRSIDFCCEWNLSDDCAATLDVSYISSLGMGITTIASNTNQYVQIVFSLQHL